MNYEAYANDITKCVHNIHDREWVLIVNGPYPYIPEYYTTEENAMEAASDLFYDIEGATSVDVFQRVKRINKSDVIEDEG